MSAAGKPEAVEQRAARKLEPNHSGLHEEWYCRYWLAGNRDLLCLNRHLNGTELASENCADHHTSETGRAAPPTGTGRGVGPGSGRNQTETGRVQARLNTALTRPGSDNASC